MGYKLLLELAWQTRSPSCQCRDVEEEGSNLAFGQS